MLSVYIPVEPLSFEAYLTYDDGSGCRYELLDNGELIELPYENDINVVLATDLYEYLKQFVNRHLIRMNSTAIQVTPTTMTLSDGRTKRIRQQSRIPDLMVLTSIGAQQIFGTPSGLALHHDNPLLIVEFVSESNAGEDYFDKRVQYEARGVREYWIADRHQQKVTVLTLVDDRYEEAIYEGNTTVRSGVLLDVAIAAEQILIVDEL